MAYTINDLKQTSALEYRTVPNGKWHVSRNGRRVQETTGIEYVPTAVGKFEQTEWMRLAKEAVLREKGATLLKAVCDHCKKHCVWLRKEAEIEAYAVNCIVSGAYLHWDMTAE